MVTAKSIISIISIVFFKIKEIKTYINQKNYTSALEDYEKIIELLDKKSETLKTIQHLRNEAPRFGITFHRDKRSKAAIQTSIELIPGIGEKTMITLIKHFKSVKRLSKATENEISEVVGLSKAKKIIEFYKESNSSK